MILRAGELNLLYENGFLRYIKHGDTEVIRMIYFALRDENWGTFPPSFENEVIKQDDDSFEIRYDCYHEKGGTRIFTWNVLILGYKHSSIVFRIKGKAHAEILKNRAGFCVLHPISETSGKPVTVIHPNGNETESVFPDFISAKNPFKEVQGLRWRLDNKEFRLLLEGDVFETEDQRNWTDSSFKTFCTPLNRPFPVKLRKGDIVKQTVSLTSTQAQRKQTPNSDLIQIKFSGPPILLPDIGIGESTEWFELTPAAIYALDQLKFRHYRIDIHLDQTDWLQYLNLQLRIPKTLNVAVELALHVSLNSLGHIDQFNEFIKRHEDSVRSILILQDGELVPRQDLLDEAIQKLRINSNVLIGTGTDYNFAELNRNLINADSVDFICYSIHPQEHAFDDRSILETVAAQYDTVVSAKQIYPSKKIHVSPITLKKRYNPYAWDPSEKIRNNTARKDQRQQEQLCALYTFGSIKHLSEAGASSLTFYQTAGHQGVVSIDGQKYPAFHLLDWVLKSSRNIRATSSNQPLICETIYFSRENRWIITNYSEKEVHVQLPDSQTIAVFPYEIKFL